MARRLIPLVLVSFAAFAPPLHARDARVPAAEPAPPPAVARFLMGTRLGYITCGGKWRAYLEQRDLYELVNKGEPNARMTQPSPEATQACVHETMYKAKSLREEAARHAVSPAAKGALREYTTAWEASLQAIGSGQPETPRAFDARWKQQEARLDELQQRVEATASR